MPRFFVAIVLPDEAKDRLVAVLPPPAPGVRLIGRQEMHPTLHFPGEIAAQQDEAVRTALATVKINMFTIALRGVGRFPPEGQPQVLWAGVENSPPLLALHRSVGSALTDAIDFCPEERPYSPHVTLARLNDAAPTDSIADYMKEHEGLYIPTVPLKQFALYSSVFENGVPRYQEEAVFPFSELASSG